jgi:hypothetical protein
MPTASSLIVNLACKPNDNIYSLSIAEGNIVKLIENHANVSYVTFVGYVASVEIAQTVRSGLESTLICFPLITQLSYQLVANNVNDTMMLGGSSIPINNFVENKVPLGNILAAFQQQSLLSYAIEKQILQSNGQYQGAQLAFSVPNGSDGLTPSTSVYFFASTNDNRFDSLLRTVYAYQRLLYQDLNGTIQIAIPSAKENSLSSFYTFDVGIICDTISSNSIPYTNYRITRNAGIVCNQTYASVLPLPFNIIKNNEQNTINYVANIQGNLFKRSQQLLSTGLFTITKHDIVDLNESIVQDPMLSQLVNVTQASNNNLIANDVSGTKQNLPVVGLYANRLLAQDLFLETQIEVELPRLACIDDQGNLQPLPLGNLVQINNENNSLNLDTSKYYCYQVGLNYSKDSGSEVFLGLCKPFTFTTLWST